MRVIATKAFNYGGTPVNEGDELIVTVVNGEMLVRIGNAIDADTIEEVEEEEVTDNDGL